MTEPVTLIRQMLEACIQGEDPDTSVLDALEGRADLPPPLASAVHELHHFADDQDIRRRDPEYARYWHNRLLGIRDEVAPA